MEKLKEQDIRKDVLRSMELLDEIKKKSEEVLNYLCEKAGDEPKPRFIKGEEVKLEVDPDITYVVKEVNTKRHGFSYSIRPKDEEKVVLVAVDENYLSKK